MVHANQQVPPYVPKLLFDVAELFIAPSPVRLVRVCVQLTQLAATATPH